MRNSIFLLSIFSLTACDPAGGKNQQTDPPASDPGALSGRARSAGEPAEGATVTAYRVNADGSLEEASTEPATTDAEGRYTVDVDLAAMAESDLIVRVDYASGGSAQGIVTAELEPGAVVIVAPIDEESSAEAEIFVSLHASGAWDDATMDSTTLRAQVDAAVGEAWSGASESERAGVAEATAAAMAAWSASAAQLDAAKAELAVEAARSAQAALDAQADASDSVSSEAYSEALISAWYDAGYSSEDLSYFGHAAAEAQVVASGDTSGEAARASGAYFASLRASLSVEAVAEAWTRGFDSAPPEQEGDELLMSIDSAASASGQLQVLVDSAWSEYVQQVWLELLSGADATRVLALTTAQSSAQTAGASLAASLAAASGAPGAIGEQCAAAMSTYRVEANTSASLSAVMSPEEAEATASIIAQLYAGGAP